jgi:hypothetical protein
MSNSGNPPDSSSSYSGFQSPYMINSDSESDSNSRQEYASQHPTVPSEMGLRYMTIPASDDSRCVQPLQEPLIGCFAHALAISIHPNHVHCFPLGTNTSSHTRLTSSDPSLPILLVSYPWITATAAFALLHVYRAAHCRNFKLPTRPWVCHKCMAGYTARLQHRPLHGECMSRAREHSGLRCAVCHGLRSRYCHTLRACAGIVFSFAYYARCLEESWTNLCIEDLVPRIHHSKVLTTLSMQASTCLRLQ